MKKYTISSLVIGLLLSWVTALNIQAQTPCENGFAGEYPCNDFDLMDQLTENQMGGGFVNDSWGWTDPETGKEYALIGMDSRTVFIDISNPTDVVIVGSLGSHTGSTTWRDVKTYKDHAFIVSESGGHGMQVFDLTRLRDVTNPPVQFTEDAHYDGFGSAHNIVINTDSGFAYGVGTSTFNGGPHFVNIQDPTNPVAAGGYSDNDYSHDAQVVTYNGPDQDYQGREILIGSNVDIVALIDITDKDNPVEISTISYPTIGYTHQGWFTEDQRYFLLGDETDELGFGFNTRTIVFDFEDLDNPQLSFEYEGPTEAIDHNGYVKGDLFYLSNYQAGMRLIDIETIEEGFIEEIAFFDTYPQSDDASFSRGLWNVYPYFESGNIVLSGGGGFFLVKQSSTLSTPEEDRMEITMYPNPAQDRITLEASTPIGKVIIYNVLGKEVANAILETKGTVNISNLQSGVYFVKSAMSTQRLIIQ